MMDQKARLETVALRQSSPIKTAENLASPVGGLRSSFLGSSSTTHPKEVRKFDTLCLVRTLLDFIAVCRSQMFAPRN